MSRLTGIDASGEPYFETANRHRQEQRIAGLGAARELRSGQLIGHILYTCMAFYVLT